MNIYCTQPMAAPGDICGRPAPCPVHQLIDVNSRPDLLRDLRDLVNNRGEYGVSSHSLRARLRALQRVAWLAARITWLETEDLLTSSGEMPRVDPDDTGEIVRPPAVDYAQAQVWR